MNPLDLHIEHGVRIDHDIQLALDIARELLLVGQPHRRETLLKRFVARQAAQCRQPCRIIQHFRSNRLRQQLRQLGIRLMQPAAEGDAVGHIHNLSRPQRVQIPEHGLAHQPGMQAGNAIHPVRAQEGQMTHAHAPPMRLVNH